jgi:hypothetical protein
LSLLASQSLVAPKIQFWSQGTKRLINISHQFEYHRWSRDFGLLFVNFV